jgi:shikimate kinase
LARLWENHRWPGTGACHRQFVDTDHWLQTEAGRTIADIVEQEGWESFRARETAALKAVTTPSAVIATGGGLFSPSVTGILCVKRAL